MLSSIKQVKVGRGIPMLCIRSIVHYINIYSRIVIQLNMYVKIITSSGFKSTILTDFVQGQLRVPFRFGRCLKFPNLVPRAMPVRQCHPSPRTGIALGTRLEISRKYTYLPEVVVSSAGSSTTRAARHKMEKKIGAEFMTSVSYRPEVNSTILRQSCII